MRMWFEVEHHPVLSRVREAVVLVSMLHREQGGNNTEMDLCPATVSLVCFCYVYFPIIVEFQTADLA